jgi:hypothetical protein
MKNKYDIDSLIKTFEIHSKKYDESLKDHKQKYPGSKQYMDDFSLSKAMLGICKEIKEIKDLLSDLPIN